MVPDNQNLVMDDQIEHVFTAIPWKVLYTRSTEIQEIELRNIHTLFPSSNYSFYTYRVNDTNSFVLRKKRIFIKNYPYRFYPPVFFVIF